MRHYDFVCVGSGYAGSILATILAKAGRKVLLIDRDRHPRFAIGESSTPIADNLLACLANQYGIAEWLPLTRYGSWKKSYPKLRCGLKRGFSYFCHQLGQEFTDDSSHSYSALVAASPNNEMSDTHWMRCDVDKFLVDVAQGYGVDFLSNRLIGELQRTSDRWLLTIKSTDEATSTSPHLTCTATWILDATGNGQFAQSMFHAGDASQELLTDARAIFAHFQQVGSVKDIDGYRQFDSSPIFDPDAAAQHHIVESGWLWMLRFDSGITSVGLMTTDKSETNADLLWAEVLHKYPSLRTMLLHASPIVSLEQGTISPANLVTSQRIARCNRHAFGDGWVSLPNAFGFIDPLHSTGIAHSLHGVGRLANIFVIKSNNVEQHLASYQRDLQCEIRWIDQLVALCYAGLPNPKLFMDLTAAYFCSVILHEKAIAEPGDTTQAGFLSYENYALLSAIERFSAKLRTLNQSQKHDDYAAIRNALQKAIEPFNTIGLLKEEFKNRILHSAVL